MNDYTILFSVCAVLLLLILLLLLARSIMTHRYPYEARPLLTRHEYQFYLLLRRETSQRGLLICPKVGMKDLLNIQTRKNRMKYFRLISQKHIDFVICDQALHVLFAIELDDSSHDTAEARKRDRFKDQAFRAARIPLKRIRTFDEAAVRELFH